MKEFFLGAILALSFMSVSSAEENVNLEPKKADKSFRGNCSIDHGRNISHDFSSNQVKNGTISDSVRTTFSAEISFGKSNTGQRRGYLNIESADSIPAFGEGKFNSADAWITDDFIRVYDNLREATFSLKRTYKDEWYGLYSNTVFAERDVSNNDSLVMFVYPIKCVGRISE